MPLANAASGRTLRAMTASVVAALVSAGAVAAQAGADAPLEVFYGFTLIDGRGGPPLEDAAMAVRGNEILTITSRRELLSGPEAPVNAVPVNLGGGWVVPGLVDAHVHLATSPDRERAEAELHRMLYSGIVAVRDMAGDARALASLARDSRLGEVEAPDVYYSALMAGPSFLEDARPQSSAAGERAGEVPWMQAVTATTDLSLAVARAKGTFATGIKIYANLEPALVAGITREAHAQDIRVWAHSMVFPTRPLDVVEAGVDVVSHVCRMAWEAMEDAPTEYHHGESARFGTFTADSPVFRQLFQAMRSRGTVLDATLAMYVRADSLQRMNRGVATGEPCDIDFARALVGEAHAAGVPIAAGTDFTTPIGAPFPALHHEIEELATGAGLPPMVAIEAATRVAAEAVGIDDRYGTLQHGRPVNFVLLAENPLEDVANLRSVRAVWKNAVRYDRAAYRPRAVVDGQPVRTVASGPNSPEAAIEGWIAAWRRFDADILEDVFLRDPALTVYSLEGNTLLEGFDAVAEHHRDLGFVAGGVRPDRELWLEDVLITDFEDSSVVTGRWYFGNRVDRATASTGPLSMVVSRTMAGWRISHLHLGSDRPSG